MAEKKQNLEYPSNANANKHPKKVVPEEKQVKKIIQGKAVKKQKNALSKVAETFFGDNLENVSHYVVHDVIVPAIKNSLTDIVGGGIERLMFGEKGRHITRKNGSSNVSYHNYNTHNYQRDARTSGSSKPRYNTVNSRAAHSFDGVAFGSREDAELVLGNLVDLCLDYGGATVADFYDLVGITSEFTDTKHGWYSVDTARVKRDRSGGYYIDLPRTTAIE